MSFKKNKIVASGVLLASLGSGLSSISVQAGLFPSLFGGSDIVVDKTTKIPTFRDKNGLVDIPTTGKYFSDMYDSDPDNFVENIKDAELFQLNVSLSYDYVNPFYNFFGKEKRERDYKEKLHLCAKKKVMELEELLEREFPGDGYKNFRKAAPFYVRDCINYDPKTSEKVPAFLVSGKDDKIKDDAIKFISRYVSGNSVASSYNVTNYSKEMFDGLIRGTKAGEMGIFGEIQSKNRSTMPVVFDDIDNMDQEALPILLTLIQDGNVRTRNGKTYDVRTPLILNASKFKNYGDLVKFGGAPFAERCLLAPCYEGKLNLSMLKKLWS